MAKAKAKKAKQANKPVELCFHRNIKIKVTQKHIDEGMPGNPNRCAIALALREVFPERADEVKVDGENIEVGDGIELTLSKSMQRFVGRFDEDMSVKPFDFNMKLAFAPVSDC